MIYEQLGSMDRIELMNIFVRLAEVESFTVVAESLHLPKASVSQAIQKLEMILGVQLFHRTTRKVQITQDGQIFLDRCKDLLSDMEDMETMFQTGGDLQGRIRVDMSIPIARDVIIPALPTFLKAHPGIEVELSSTDRMVDIVREGFDCVIRTGQLKDSSHMVRKITEHKIINCASLAYLKAHGVPKGIADLKHHYLIRYSSTFSSRPDDFEYLQEGKLQREKMKSLITVNNADAYRSACLAGLGIIQAPEIGVKKDIAAGKLVEILPKFKSEVLPVSFVYPHKRYQAKRVRVFMDWAQKLVLDHSQG